MGTLEYALVPRGKKRLKLLFTGPWETAIVELDGATLWTMESRSELERGHNVTLPDGRVLGLKLVQAYGSTELNVTYDGVPVPGSPSDPSAQANQATLMLGLFAVLTAVLAIVAETLDYVIMDELSLGWPSLIVAAVYGVLAALTLRRSKAALLVSIAVFIVDSIVVLLLGSEESSAASVAVLLLRALLVIPLLRAVPALDALAYARRIAAAKERARPAQ